MIRLSVDFQYQGQPVQGKILVPETKEDLSVFFDWFASTEGRILACDTETTGLDVYSDTFELRTIQIGMGLNAWVLPYHLLDDVSWLAERDLIFQNAAYDYNVIRKVTGLQLDWGRIVDTKILAHLVDSRPTSVGGTGHSLQELTAYYIDPELASKVKGSMTEMAKSLKVKKDVVFKEISVWDETYLRYAGTDVILAYALYNILLPLVPQPSKGLLRREHEVARVCAEIEYNGMLLDVEYSTGLRDEYNATADYYEALAYAEYGLEKIASAREIASIAQEEGYSLTKLTNSGEYAMDEGVLKGLAEKGFRLAEYVLAAKKYRKWSKTWVEKFLDSADSDNRCHANINPLQARTGRMSITGIPAQTLPSGDWVVRRCFIPEPGYVMLSCDYQTQELRVLAALSGDPTMQDAFKHDKDLHQMTADASGVDRSVGKTVNFAYVYGSGPANIAETCSITVDKAKEVMKGFENSYPLVKTYNQKLQKEAQMKGYIVTPSGRVLDVDKDRPYSALNYVVQSTSRDITCAALLRLDAAGYTKYIRLPIHDEMLFCVPEDEAEELAKTLSEIMACDFAGVHIGTDADVYGPSWGHGYMDK